MSIPSIHVQKGELSNQLIERPKSSKFGPLAVNLFAFMLAQIRKEDDQFHFYEIPRQMLVDYFNLKSNATEEIDRAVQQLSEFRVERVSKKKSRGLYMSVIPTIGYDEGKVSWRFNVDLKEDLLELKSRFTKFELSTIYNLKNSYSFLGYLLMKSMLKGEDSKKTTYDLDSFKKAIGIPDKKYKMFGHFKKDVLDKVQKEINEKSDIEFTYDKVKEGRKVVSLSFSIKKKKNWQGFLDYSPKATKKIILDSVEIEENKNIMELYRAWEKANGVKFPELSDFKNYNKAMEEAKQILSGEGAGE